MSFPNSSDSTLCIDRTPEQAMEHDVSPKSSKSCSIAAASSQDSGIVQLRLFDVPEYISRNRKRVSDVDSLSDVVRGEDIQVEIPDFLKVRYPK